MLPTTSALNKSCNPGFSLSLSSFMESNQRRMYGNKFPLTISQRQTLQKLPMIELTKRTTPLCILAAVDSPWLQFIRDSNLHDIEEECAFLAPWGQVLFQWPVLHSLLCSALLSKSLPVSQVLCPLTSHSACLQSHLTRHSFVAMPNVTDICIGRSPDTLVLTNTERRREE